MKRRTGKKTNRRVGPGNPARKKVETMEPQKPSDDYTIRCPRLGHNLAFSYCARESGGLPCFKTLDCWFEHFEVRAFLEARLPAEKLQRVFGRPPQPKVLSLVELIGQAKKNGAVDTRK